MELSKTIHVYCDTSSKVHVYSAYEEITTCYDDSIKPLPNGKIPPVDDRLIDVVRNQIFLTDNPIQMDSFLYRLGYSCNDVIED